MTHFSNRTKSAGFISNTRGTLEQNWWIRAVILLKWKCSLKISPTCLGPHLKCTISINHLPNSLSIIMRLWPFTFLKTISALSSSVFDFVIRFWLSLISCSGIKFVDRSIGSGSSTSSLETGLRDKQSASEFCSRDDKVPQNQTAIIPGRDHLIPHRLGPWDFGLIYMLVYKKLRIWSIIATEFSLWWQILNFSREHNYLTTNFSFHLCHNSEKHGSEKMYSIKTISPPSKLIFQSSI